MRLGLMIVDFRNVECMGVREAAKQIGISAATLSRIERGENCDGATLIKVLAWVLAPMPDRRKPRP